MFQIQAQNISKKFNRDTIFSGFNFTFNTGKAYAILGHNGSGKSTLLQILSSYLTPTEGTLVVSYNNETIARDQAYKHISLAAPYTQLIEDYTLAENVDFYFKMLNISIKVSTILEACMLLDSKDKLLKNCSSGMKQRLKIGLAILAQKPILLLDEPCTNLDAQGVAWYQALIQIHTANKLVIISSNIPHEYDFCETKINIQDYKS